MTRSQSSLAALALLLGCAGYQYVEPEDAEPQDDGPGPLSGLGGAGAGSAGKPAVSKAGGGAGGKPMSTTGGRGGNATAGKPSMSEAGTAGEGEAGSGGEPGVEPPLCDEATATVLGAMNANATVLSNVCLKIALAADQTWITKVTLQPEFGQYPLPFTWTNCNATGSGAFTANYGNQVIQPVNLQCPVLIKLGGNAAQQVNVQWWGG